MQDESLQHGLVTKRLNLMTDYRHEYNLRHAQVHRPSLSYSTDHTSVMIINRFQYFASFGAKLHIML